MDNRIVVACDLDGTLAEYDGWRGESHIGKVVPSIKAAIENVQAQGGEVWIFTARVSDGNANTHTIIGNWLAENGIKADGITATKHKFFTHFWDDRAIQVLKNEGVMILEADNHYLPSSSFTASGIYKPDLKGDGIAVPLAPFTPAPEDNSGSNVPDMLRESADVFEERGRQYGYIYKTMHPDVFSALFPNGMELKTHDDFTRFALINAIVGKLTRYANNFTKGGHHDSLIDLVNFAAMLNGVDDEISKR